MSNNKKNRYETHKACKDRRRGKGRVAEQRSRNREVPGSIPYLRAYDVIIDIKPS